MDRLLHQATFVHVIPGTTFVSHLEENVTAAEVNLSAEIIEKLDNLINYATVSGPRYNTATQADIDTEEIGHPG